MLSEIFLDVVVLTPIITTESKLSKATVKFLILICANCSEISSLFFLKNKSYINFYEKSIYIPSIKSTEFSFKD